MSTNARGASIDPDAEVVLEFNDLCDTRADRVLGENSGFNDSTLNLKLSQGVIMKRLFLFMATADRLNH